MNQIRLAPEAQVILDVVAKLQCVHVAQLDYFLPPPKTGCSNTGKGASVASFLARKKMIAKDGDVVFPYHTQKFSQECIDSIWLLIHLLNAQDDGKHISEKLTACMQGEYPVALCCIINNSYVIKTLPILTETAIPLITFEQDRYYTNTKVKVGEESKSKLQYILIIREPRMLDEISKLDLTFNHKIALLEGDFGTMPAVKFFSSGD